MGVKAVYYIKILHELRCLHRQIRGASAAENHDIDFILHLHRIFNSADRNALCLNPDGFRRASCKYCRQFHIRVLLNRTFYASAQVSIA